MSAMSLIEMFLPQHVVNQIKFSVALPFCILHNSYLRLSDVVEHKLVEGVVEHKFVEGVVDDDVGGVDAAVGVGVVDVDVVDVLEGQTVCVHVKSVVVENVDRHCQH